MIAFMKTKMNEANQPNRSKEKRKPRRKETSYSLAKKDVERTYTGKKNWYKTVVSEGKVRYILGKKL